MHFCGNPLHDAPLYIMLALPWFAPIFLWIRSKLQRKCECGEKHDHGEKHV